MGEAKKGYNVSVDTTNKILKLHLWGLWDTTLAQRFTGEAKETILELSQQAPQGWYTLVDLSHFPPQFEEIQKIAAEIMTFEVDHGMKKAATLFNKMLIKLQMQRLAKQQHLPPGSFFQSEGEAIQWLLHEQ